MSGDPRSIVRRLEAPSSVSRPVVTPIYPSVVYRSRDADELDAQYEGREAGYTYAREGHPNAALLAEKLDWLEGGSGGVITSSGMAAISVLFLGLLKKGDHILGGDQLYGRSLRLLKNDLPNLGFETSLADMSDASSIAAAIRPNTRMILAELVSNPTVRVADIEGLAKIARENGLILAMDNTFTTPRALRPLEHGANIVIHSITKLLAGHSDVTLGYALADTPERNQALSDACATWGFNSSPFDCWLAERGLHSFEIRYDRAEQNAGELAQHLNGMAGIEQVFYPGLENHPDHSRAKRLLGNRFGNMLSFRMQGGRARVNAFLRAAEHIAFAPTLGDVGTTLSHPASSSHRGISASEREALGISEGFIRVSVGIEDAEQLKSEIGAAISATA